jgi:hypothetical protein
MRPYPLLVAALLLLSPPRHAAGGEKVGIGWDNGIAARAGKAATVAELADMYDARHCRDCHPERAREWDDSLHARSIYGTGRTLAAIASTITAGLSSWPHSGVAEPGDVQVRHLMGCAKCHLPQLADASDDVAKEIVGDIFRYRDAASEGDEKEAARLKAKLSSLSIGCLVCHNRNAVGNRYVEGYPLVRTVYGGKDLPAHLCGKFPRYGRSATMDGSLQCAQCHGQGPNFEFDNPTQCATLYGSYLFSYRAVGGKEECQDCHMRKGGQGHRIQAYRSPYMISEAVDFAAEAAPASLRVDGKDLPAVAAETSIRNRAGHSIPDG